MATSALQQDVVKRVRRAWRGILRALSVDEPMHSFHTDYDETDVPEVEEVLGPYHPKTIEIIEAIWGRGFNMPGGKPHVLDLAKPFALDNQMNMLYLNSGYGGGVIAVAGKFGCYATAYEYVPELGEIVKRNIDMSQVRARLKMQESDLEDFALKNNSFDCVLSHEFLFRTEHKPRFLKAIRQGLRMYGQLSLTDFMLSTEKPPSAACRKWMENEPYPVHLWSVHRYEQEINALKLDLRVTENMSKQYHHYLTTAFQDFINRYEAGKIAATKGQLQILVSEVERWARLASLLETGELQLHRYFALKPVNV